MLRLIGDPNRTNLLARHSIFFVSPTAKIDQLAALGTKWPRRIVSAFNGLSTRWTFRHDGKVRRKQGKVKAGRNPTVREGAIPFG
jgi:hypothetical protein